MKELRQAMNAELKASLLPTLRDHLFQGSLPHFRRTRSNGIDLLTIQFDKHGGGFVIEIARCPAEGITTYWGKHIPPSKVTAWDIHPKERQRVQPRKGSGREDWFRFDQGDVKAAALNVRDYLPMAEAWWHAHS